MMDVDRFSRALEDALRRSFEPVPSRPGDLPGDPVPNGIFRKLRNPIAYIGTADFNDLRRSRDRELEVEFRQAPLALEPTEPTPERTTIRFTLLGVPLFVVDEPRWLRFDEDPRNG